MNTQKAVLELVKLLSEAIDMMRNDGRNIDATYIEKQMQNILDQVRDALLSIKK